MAKLRNCTCQHTPKKHKQSGRCRGECDCNAAALKAERKRKGEFK